MKFGEKYNRLAKKFTGQHVLKNLCALIIANGAWSCYDRIIIMVSYITMILFGIQRVTAKSLLECLLLMLYFIRMVFGDSDISYGGLSWIRKPHGNGQGNGMGSSLLAGISLPRYKILRQEGYGVKLHGAISNITMETTGFVFADDADLIQGAVKGETILTLL